VVLPSPRVGFRGIVHLTARDGAGKVIFRHSQPNLITDEGLRLLRSRPLVTGTQAVLSHAILGTRTSTPGVGDGGHNSTPAAEDSPLGAYLSRAMQTPDPEWCFSPFAPPQLRSARGWTNNNNSVADVLDNVWASGVYQYSRVIRSRHFTFSDAVFPLANPANILNGMTAWGLSLVTEADNLAEICFASTAPELNTSASLNCGEAGTLNWVEVRAPQPFTRVLFMEEGEPFTVGWGPGADVSIPEVGTLTVAYELRMYLELEPVVATLTIGSTSTTVQTGHQRLTENATGDLVYAAGLLAHFGGFEAQVTNNYRWGTSNTPPSTPAGNLGSGTNPTSLTLGPTGDHYREMYLTLGASIANDGIGHVLWGSLQNTSVANRQTLYTTFNPVISKTNLQRAVFHLRHSWGRA